MRTANPTLNESAFNKMWQGTPPTTVDRTSLFTVEGAIYKTLALLGITIVTGIGSVALVPESLLYPVMIGGAILGFITALVASFKPQTAPVSAPVYAAFEGLFLGGFTLYAETLYDGIATQAALGTMLTLGVMLVLYRTGVIKVTQRFRMVVMTAMFGIVALYLVSFVMSIFGSGLSILSTSNTSGFAILLNVAVIGVAALMLALDFDFIEAAANRGAPAKMEWYAAFGLMVTLVWLYIEIMRLLMRLQSRD